MTRTLHLSLLLAVATFWTATAQDASSYYSIDPTPPTRSFDVASIREAATNRGTTWGVLPGRFVATTTVDRLISYAYRLSTGQLLSPDWTRSEYFVIGATFPTSPEPDRHVREMVRALLAERFSLRFRIESRRETVYALVVDKPDGSLGPKLSKTTTDCDVANSVHRPPVGTQPSRPTTTDPLTPLRPFCLPNQVLIRKAPEGYVYFGGGYDIENVARMVSGQVGRRVVDRTGLKGAFDFQLLFTPIEQLRAGSGTTPDFAIPMSVALKEQLGLRLVDAEDAVDVLVITNVDRPAPN
jgi:uncharacterized protein (TIGR03435 family)